jgi:hypothetical protein
MATGNASGKRSEGKAALLLTTGPVHPSCHLSARAKWENSYTSFAADGYQVIRTLPRIERAFSLLHIIRPEDEARCRGPILDAEFRINALEIFADCFRLQI